MYKIESKYNKKLNVLIYGLVGDTSIWGFKNRILALKFLENLKN